MLPYNQTEPPYNQTEPEYNLPEPEYNLPEPEYNLPELEYNLPEPEYNLPEPEYNLPESQQQKWTTCPVKIAIFRGLGGVPQIFFRHKSYFFCELGPHTKFHNPRTTPSGRKVCDPERKKKERKKKEERKIMPKIVDTTFPLQRQGQRTHFARTKIKNHRNAVEGSACTHFALTSCTATQINCSLAAVYTCIAEPGATLAYCVTS